MYRSFRRVGVLLVALLCTLALVQAVVAAPPAADFTISDATPQIGQSVDFDSTVADPTYLYAWDFGDGANGIGASTSHAYGSAGPKDVTLTITDPIDSVSTSVTKTVNVNQPPTVSLSCSPTTVAQNQATGCTASASESVSYAWDSDGDGFDDGSDSSETFSYPTAGTKTIRVRATDSGGATATDQQQITVNPTLPTAKFTITPNPALISENVRLDASASKPKKSIDSYDWDLDDDGNYDDATGAIITRSFATAGNRPISLQVTHENGSTDTRDRQVRVQVTRPNAAFRFAPAAPLPGRAVRFSSRSTSSGSGRQITNTQWDFNYDPTQDFAADATGAAATTSFATPGPKTVAIKVTETGGGFAIASGTVVVNAVPLASFNVAPTAPLGGDTVTLFSTSSDPDGPLGAQLWDLDGDGRYDDAAGAVASRAFAAGSHVVRLRVFDSQGAVATAARTIKVLKRPPKLLTGVKITLFGNLTDRGARLRRLVVRTPAKATAKVSCKGRKCPKGARAASRRTSKTRRLRFKKFERSFLAGTLIKVTVTRPGYIGQYTTIKIRSGQRRYIRRDRCIVPGMSKPTACPEDS